MHADNDAPAKPVGELCPTTALAYQCEKRFQKNIAALATIAPAVAERVRLTPLVVTYLAPGRDDSLVCRVEIPGGERRWVGGSVVPQWATAQMLDSVDLPPTGHMFLAPFDGGHALNALFNATYEHQQIFVLEESPELFAGTLLVADVAEAFASGRLRVFLGSDLGRQLVAYLDEHPGRPAPEHLITTSTVHETVAFYRQEVAYAESILNGDRRDRGKEAA